MSASAQFRLADSFDWNRFEQLQQKQLDTTTKISAPPEAQHIIGLSLVDVLVGSMSFTARSDHAHVESITGTLYFYQRHMFRSFKEWNTTKHRTLEHIVKRMFGLSVPVAFALQHNVNDGSERQWFDGDSTRCELVHRLLKARRPVTKPKHALMSTGWSRCTLSGFVRSAGKKRLPFSDAAGAVVLFDECPLERRTKTTMVVKKKKSGRRMATKRPIYKAVTTYMSTVRDTPYETLKLIFEATGNTVGHAWDQEKDELIDYDSRGVVSIQHLCRQLMEYAFEDTYDLSLLAKAAAEPTRTCRQKQVEHRTAHGNTVLDELRANERHTGGDMRVAHLPLHLLQIVELETFNVKKHLGILFSVLRNVVQNSKVAKRYRFKNRRHKKQQTHKAVGKTRMVQQRMDTGGGDWAHNFYSIGNSGCPYSYYDNEQYSKKNRRFWKKRLLQPDYMECGIRKEKKSCRQIMQERRDENDEFNRRMRAKHPNWATAPRYPWGWPGTKPHSMLGRLPARKAKKQRRLLKHLEKGGLAKYDKRLKQKRMEQRKQEEARKQQEKQSAPKLGFHVPKSTDQLRAVPKLVLYRSKPTATTTPFADLLGTAPRRQIDMRINELEHVEAFANAQKLFEQMNARTEWTESDVESGVESEGGSEVESEVESEGEVETLPLFDQAAISEVDRERARIEGQQANPLASVLVIDDIDNSV